MSQSFTKRLINNFLRDTAPTRAMSLTRLFDIPYQVTEVYLNPYDSYTVINVTMEDQVMIYPTVIVHQQPDSPNTVIDIE